MNARLLAVPSLLALALSASAQQTPPAVTVLKAARLFDGTRDTTVANGVVVIEGGAIKAVGSGLAVPAGATVIDLGDATLLPGIIDAHVHLTGESGDNWYRDVVDGLRRGVPEQAIRATELAQRTLLAGVTTVRNVGRGRLRRRRAAQRHRGGRRPGPAHAGRDGLARLARRPLRRRPAFPTCCSAARRASRTASPPGPTSSATPCASRSSTART